jgi:hypothetical protein
MSQEYVRRADAGDAPEGFRRVAMPNVGKFFVTNTLADSIEKCLRTGDVRGAHALFRWFGGPDIMEPIR